jgi:hypothetical protein
MEGGGAGRTRAEGRRRWPRWEATAGQGGAGGGRARTRLARHAQRVIAHTNPFKSLRAQQEARTQASTQYFAQPCVPKALILLRRFCCTHR